MKKYIKQASIVLGSACLSTGIAFAGIAFAGSDNAHWGYSGDQGPANWGHLSPEFEMCAKGKNQSPINKISTIESVQPPITFSYASSPHDVINNGHTIKASMAPGSSITVEGHTYELKQVHWHTPSENHIDGRSFPMEAHFVHADTEGSLAVIGIMYVKGREDASIVDIWNQMPAKTGEVSNKSDCTVNPMDMLPATRDYYRFNGSLTTPPCSEGVRWMVMKDPVEASAEQVEKFHSSFHGDTNRPIQPVNARPILQ
jgi:carbonic anhydrase